MNEQPWNWVYLNRWSRYVHETKLRALYSINFHHMSAVDTARYRIQSIIMWQQVCYFSIHISSVTPPNTFSYFLYLGLTVPSNCTCSLSNLLYCFISKSWFSSYLGRKVRWPFYIPWVTLLIRNIWILI